MANFKRSKTKRCIRCTICTHYKWMGNNKGRFKAKEDFVRSKNVFKAMES